MDAEEIGAVNPAFARNEAVTLKTPSPSVPTFIHLPVDKTEAVA
jgi:hypothetical protein